MLAFLQKSFMAPVWLVARILLGWEWLTAGLDKIGSSAAWYGPHAGAAVAGMVQGAIAQTAGTHPQVLGPSASIAHAIVTPTAAFWGAIIPWAELLVGIGLIVGGLTGTALMGAMAMNLVYMLMGSDGVNPVMFAVEAALLAVGPAVALWGLDHWVFHNWRNRHLVFHPNEPSHPAGGGFRAA
jgi:thiosulfate dehydrogenase [quinone] large subunit